MRIHKRKVGEVITAEKVELDALLRLVRKFADAVAEKLTIRVLEDWTGWDDPGNLPLFRERLTRNFEEGDMIDVGAFAALIWNHKDEN